SCPALASGVTVTVVARDPLNQFSAGVAAWFRAAFERPTPAQEQGWPPIARGEHALILAPTGSGKTLAAFLWALDRIASDSERGRTRVLYVSPLKALNHDVERNLRVPLAGIAPEPPISVALRSGDTTQSAAAWGDRGVRGRGPPGNDRRRRRP